ncbi:MAG: response regulator [Draconibacterium sp.]|nr:response regulator [Draconibacterium sp.]
MNQELESISKSERIVAFITESVRDGNIKIGNIIPSINATALKFGVARKTVVRAYDKLKKQGVIESRPKIGYFVISKRPNIKLRVVIIVHSFDEYWETLYNEFREKVNSFCEVEIYFHHYNIKVLELIINRNVNDYDLFIISSFNNSRIKNIIGRIPAHKVLIISRNDYLNSIYNAVIQDFFAGTYNALCSANSNISKYKKINLSFPEKSGHSPTLKMGFIKYCKEFSVPYSIYNSLKDVEIEKDEAYLIIDDNEVNRSILEEQMAAWKFECTSCEDGRGGLDVMREAIKQGRSIDCIVLDYQMPGMSGGDVVREMKADDALKELPIVMLTSVDQTEDGKVFSSLGINGQLTKPARSSLLLETIIQVLQENGPARALHDTSALALESEHTLPASKPAPASGQKAIDILVCEDNEVNQIVFTQILQTTDYSFRIAKDGKEGLAFYKTYSPKLVLMDISMPHMNGMEATKAIRMIEAGSLHTPIVAVTAHAIKGDMEKCIAAGMDDYLSKPISPDKLEEKIHYWLDKSKADVA